MHCLVYLPHSYTGRGPAESCVRAIERFSEAGLETTLFVVRSRAEVPASTNCVKALGSALNWLPWRLIKAAGTKLLNRKFVRAIDAAQPGDIAYFWPDVPADLVRRARAKGLICVREMINSPVDSAKVILDAAYDDAGLVPAHPITAQALSKEAEELPLHHYFFTSNQEVETSLVAHGYLPEQILPTAYGWAARRFSASPRRPRPRRSREGDTPLRVGFAGLINVRKGVPQLLAAWEQANIDSELWLAGVIEPSLQALVGAQLQSGRVRHLGQVTDIAQFYADIDCFVFPAFEEGGPQVTSEAAICGLPIITTPMGAARIVEHGVSGLVVPSGDVAAIAAALRTLAGDRQFAQELGEAAYKKALPLEYGEISRARAKTLLGLTLASPRA